MSPPKTQMQLLVSEVEGIVRENRRVLYKLKIKHPSEPFDVFTAKIDAYREVIGIAHTYITGKRIGEG